MDTILRRGDSVVRLLTTNEEDLTELVDGLGQYVQAFGGGLSEERLPDGSGFAYFKNFIYVDDIEHFLCSELANAPDEFSGLRDAILSLQTEIDCSDYFERSPAAPAGGPGAPALPTPSQDDLDAAAQRLVDQLYGLLGQPQGAIDQDLDSLLAGLVEPGEVPS